MVKLIVGLVAIIFFARYVFASAERRAKRAASQYDSSDISGPAIAGFTSFVAHAGGPALSGLRSPSASGSQGLQWYQRDFLRCRECGESHTIFRARAIRCGRILKHRRFSCRSRHWRLLREHGSSNACAPEVFYPFMYGMILLMGLKLTYDGIASVCYNS